MSESMLGELYYIYIQYIILYVFTGLHLSCRYLSINQINRFHGYTNKKDSHNYYLSYISYNSYINYLINANTK